MRSMNLLAILGVVGMASACGSDDGGFSSGVDPMKSAGSLSDAEAQQICKATVTYVNDQFNPEADKSKLCKFGGVFGASLALGFNSEATDAELQAACKQGYDGCLASDLSDEFEQQDPNAECADATGPMSSTCTATVGEYEQCLADSMSALHSWFDAIPSCDSLTKTWLAANSEGMSAASPASCQTFEAKCPDVDSPDFSGIFGDLGEDDEEEEEDEEDSSQQF